MYVVRTSVDQSAMSASEAVERYKDLGAVEQAFRCMKTLDLKVRPIHHRLEGRVRAHVFLCMLAYYLDNPRQSCIERERRRSIPPYCGPCALRISRAIRTVEIQEKSLLRLVQ
jgi:hypothetical protein